MLLLIGFIRNPIWVSFLLYSNRVLVFFWSSNRTFLLGGVDSGLTCSHVSLSLVDPVVALLFVHAYETLFRFSIFFMVGDDESGC